MGLITYISLIVTDQDLHLGILESPLLVSSLDCVSPMVYYLVHVLKLSRVTSVRVQDIVT